MAEERKSELRARFCEGSASAEEIAEIAEAIGESPEERQELAAEMVGHRVLRAVAGPPLVARIMEGLPQQPSYVVDAGAATLPRRRRGRVWAVALAAAAAIVLIVAVLRDPATRETGQTSRRPPEFVSTPSGEALVPGGSSSGPRAPAFGQSDAVEHVNGQVFALGQDRRPLTVGAAIPEGSAVATVGQGSAATFILGGVRVALGGNTIVTPVEAIDEGSVASLLLAQGWIVVDAPAPRVLRVTTPHAEARGVGARLRVEVTPGRTRVEVQRGEALLRTSGDAETRLEAGRYAVTVEGGPPTVGTRPRGGVVLFVHGSPAINRADRAIIERLKTLGFGVRDGVPGASALIDDARSSDLVVISSTISTVDLEPGLRELPVPILTWESYLYDDLGMTEACDEDHCGLFVGNHGVAIKQRAHPLAAGLSGARTTSEPAGTSWGTPSLRADWIATLSGDSSKATIFAYEKGVQMPGAVAPARRVGFFLDDDAAETLLPDGWALFDAAVKWCAEQTAP